jgi:hypothetical protein
MPSRVVDDLWHQFILDTREYERFCKLAFGGFFHHVPATANPPGKRKDAALRATWRYACLAEGIYSPSPTRLPMLFAIDSELQIENGQSFINWIFSARRGKNAGDGGSGCGGGDSHGGGCGGTEGAVEDAGGTDCMTRVAVSIPAVRPHAVSTNGKARMVPEVGVEPTRF